MGDTVRFDEPMAAHTSFRVGGPADAYAVPESPEVLRKLIRGCGERNIPHTLIGGGTNLLVRDKGIRGVVIAMTRRFSEIRTSFPTRSGPENLNHPGQRLICQSGKAENSRKGEETFITAGAGSRLSALCAFALRNGLGGMNFAMGIPGTVGGAICMNAGTAIGSMGDTLEFVKILLPGGEIERIQKEKLNFSYRRFSIRRHETEIGDSHCCDSDDFVLLEGRFRLYPTDPGKLMGAARELLRTRRKKQPPGPSAGCFFKNPFPAGSASGLTKMVAGKLLDRAGLKGKRVGGAEISPIHANFIINRNRASAADILALAELVRETVAERFDLELEPEVRIIGE